MFQICTFCINHKSGHADVLGFFFAVGRRESQATAHFLFSVCCCLTERSVVHGRCLGHLNKDILSCPLGAGHCGENVSRKVGSPGSELLNPPKCWVFLATRGHQTQAVNTIKDTLSSFRVDIRNLT